MPYAVALYYTAMKDRERVALLMERTGKTDCPYYKEYKDYKRGYYLALEEWKGNNNA